MDMHSKKEGQSFLPEIRRTDAITAIINLTFPWCSKLKSEQNSEIRK